MAISGKDVNTGVKVLLVNDNQELAFVTGKLLGASGFQTQICFSGQQCIEISARTQPDVILLDIDMPDIDGYTVCQYIRKQTWGKKPFILALSAHSEKSFIERSYKAGFDRYLLLPVFHSELSMVITDFVNKNKHAQ